MDPATAAGRRVLTQSPEETREAGRALGETLAPGTVLALVGGLGAGKTCFAQGLAVGLGVDPEVAVTSPTFTLVNEYPGRVPFVHADLYRLENAAELDTTGLFDGQDPDSVTAVEWADRVDEALLMADMVVSFEITGETSRALTFIDAGRDMFDLADDLDFF
ncbi:MAG: tRNA (adenosine(37)-N6)-threonylcarbamoyltransferase complex ATPase subunit type 1 TsaE [Deltaproteobacteria bacterium]|nr:tRNA (adenosine(37)-N6)-threonylcarbamoyltransferase complex ATPase subunit type 1 TsaE [Deltaproteobacteria bacterium]